jgi:hypothetical protein
MNFSFDCVSSTLCPNSIGRLPTSDDQFRMRFENTEHLVAVWNLFSVEGPTPRDRRRLTHHRQFLLQDRGRLH